MPTKIATLLAVLMLQGCGGPREQSPRFVQWPCFDHEAGSVACGAAEPVDAGMQPYRVRLECKKDVDPVTGARTGPLVWVGIATPCE